MGSAWDGSSDYGFIYDSGSVTRLSGPTGALSTNAIGISNNSMVVGSWFDGTRSAPFVYSAGHYSLTSISIDGSTDVTLQGISPDGRYITGFYPSQSGGSVGFAYDLSTSKVVGRIGDGSKSVIAQGINSFGQVVGNIGNNAFLYDIKTGLQTNSSFSGVTALRARAINDQGQIAGWLLSTADTGTTSQAWVGNASGYQVIAIGSGRPEIGEGINNLGRVVGFLTSTTHEQDTGLIASPVVLPTAAAPGADPHIYSFATAVVADVPVFIDPLVAIGYVYKTGTGNPLFKTVSLPAGVGDNQFEIVVAGQHFNVAGNQIFDFSAHGFGTGVTEFTVLGIEPQSLLDPADPHAFVTRVTLSATGTFTGTQTALTLDYAPTAVPEPGSLALMLIGLVGMGLKYRTQW